MLAKAVARFAPKTTLRIAPSPSKVVRVAEPSATIDTGVRLLTQADAEIPLYIAKDLVGKTAKSSTR